MNVYFHENFLADCLIYDVCVYGSPSMCAQPLVFQSRLRKNCFCFPTERRRQKVTEIQLVSARVGGYGSTRDKTIRSRRMAADDGYDAGFREPTFHQSRTAPILGKEQVNVESRHNK